jgi:hypothetical protein
MALLLVPPGSPEALEPTPDGGADLVYLGLKGWSWGEGVLRGHNVCTLEHLPRLLADGCRYPRIGALSESPAYRAALDIRQSGVAVLQNWSGTIPGGTTVDSGSS